MARELTARDGENRRESFALSTAVKLRLIVSLCRAGVNRAQLNFAARVNNSGVAVLSPSRGDPGWMQRAGQPSAAFTNSAKVPAARSATNACRSSLYWNIRELILMQSLQLVQREDSM
jgi:hypothetical protein